MLSIVIPCYNEAVVIEKSVDKVIDFSEFILLRYMIETLYNVSEGEAGLAELTVSEKEFFVQFIEYLEQYNGYNKYSFITENYVSDFIGCSRGCSAVQQKISVLKQERNSLQPLCKPCNRNKSANATIGDNIKGGG